MRIVSTAWISGDLAVFGATNCLASHAAVGYASKESPFDIYVLAGFDKVTDAFAAPLRERHINLLDASSAMLEVESRFPNLAMCIGAGQGVDYECKCFLRWLVLQTILGAEPFIHIDLDLFLQRPFAEISRVFSGLTGTFGSPCLTSVAHASWLDTYSCALTELVADRAGLQSRLGYAGNDFRKDISSDQDLVAALESSGALPQHGLASLHDRFHVFINPLWPYQHKPAQPMDFVRIGKTDVLGAKPVLFWHLQNNAADYLSRFALLMSYRGTWMEQYLPIRLSLPFIQLMPSAENFAFDAFRRLAWQRIEERILHGLPVEDMNGAQYFARSWVSDWFIVQGEGRGLFGKDYWWEDGVFT